MSVAQPGVPGLAAAGPKPDPPRRRGVATGYLLLLPGLLWLLLFSVIGGVVGAQLDGRLDLARAVSTTSGKGRS